MSFLNSREALSLEIKGVRLPKIEIPDEDLKRVGVEKGVSTEEFLLELCKLGYKEKMKEGILDPSRKKEYGERIKYELEILNDTGFTDYILLVWDVINFCLKNDIPVGHGRGSAAGSLVLYFIGVTNVDPIVNKLYFERFVTKARAKSQIIDGIQYIDGDLAPDVDLDICHHKRDQVIRYLEEKYPSRFSKLPTYQTLQSKVLIKECGKIIKDYEEDKMKLVSGSIPSLFGKVHSLDKAYKESEKFKEFCDDNPDVLKVAKKLQKLIKHRGSHASAYLISFNPLETHMPCELSPQGEKVCAEDMGYAQKESIKLDLLGLDAVTLVQAVCKRVGIDSNKIDVNDYEGIYSHLQNVSCPYGLFQISGDANFGAVKKIKPRNLADLAAIVALARPGAMKFIDDYVNETLVEDTESKEYDEILKDTKGVIIFQEQLMAIANKVFKLSLEDAELIRRATGKKKKEEMKKFKDIIAKKGEELGLEETAAKYWDSLLASADYSFNKSHAVAYATLSALTTYLKFNYPLEFFLECLIMALNKSKPLKEITLIHQELYKFGIQLLPPDLVHSEMDFSIENGNIRFGLSAIKGISDKSLGNLQDFIDKDKSAVTKFDVFQAGQQAKLNIGIMSSLIQAGALSSFSNNRTLVVLEAQLWNLLTDRERLYLLENGGNYDYKLLDAIKDIDNWKGANGKNIARKTRFNTIKKRYERYKDIYLKNKEHPVFASWAYEKKLLGYSYSCNLKDVFSHGNKDLVDMASVEISTENERIEFVGEIIDIHKSRAQNSGEKYIRMTLSDESGSFTAMLYGSEKVDQFLESVKIPKEEDVIFVKGRKGTDIVWIDKMTVQSYKIYMKLADLK